MSGTEAYDVVVRDVVIGDVERKASGWLAWDNVREKFLPQSKEHLHFPTMEAAVEALVEYDTACRQVNALFDLMEGMGADRTRLFDRDSGEIVDEVYFTGL